ncbi:hypothetical protein Tco_0285860 [Tanacetum coccineum]
MTAMRKSAYQFISRPMDKKDKVVVQNEDRMARLKRDHEEDMTRFMKGFYVTIVHQNRMDMLERDHEEWMEMIEMLLKWFLIGLVTREIFALSHYAT